MKQLLSAIPDIEVFIKNDLSLIEDCDTTICIDGISDIAPDAISKMLCIGGIGNDLKKLEDKVFKMKQSYEKVSPSRFTHKELHGKFYHKFQNQKRRRK